MIGAIIGDIVGSIYEHRKIGTKNFPLFHPLSTWTDDTVLSLAVAEAMLTGKSYGDTIRGFARRYPGAGYGGSFIQWMMDDTAGPYNSWGNGSAMRVAAIGYAFNSKEEVLKEAAASASVTHNHPEGIKGAQAIALSIFLARHSLSKDRIRQEISSQFNYNLNRTIKEIRPSYKFDVSCAGSVPEAIIAFLDSNSFEDTIRNAVFLDGDSDTIAAMAGSIAEAWYGGVPGKIRAKALSLLPSDLKDVYNRFAKLYIPSSILKGSGTVSGWFETKLESMKYIVHEPESESEKSAYELFNVEMMDSSYFKHNIGFMGSDAVDTFGMTAVEVKDIKDDSDIEEVLEDLYSVDVRDERELHRRDMLEKGLWYYDNGKVVAPGKYLAVSNDEQIFDFVDSISKDLQVNICIPDSLLFLDLFKIEFSLKFFLETADCIYVNLNGFLPESVKMATVDMGSAVDHKNYLENSNITLWIINQIYWLGYSTKTYWYSDNPKQYIEILADKAETEKINYYSGKSEIG